MATAKHKFPEHVFNPANQNLVEFLGELHKLAKNSLGKPVQAVTEQCKQSKMLHHLKKSIDQAHWKMAHMKKL